MNTTARCEVTLLATERTYTGGRRDTMVIVSVKHYLKEWEAKSGCCGDMMEVAMVLEDNLPVVGKRKGCGKLFLISRTGTNCH